MDRVSDEELLQGFIEDCELRDMTQKTIENYKSATYIFKNFFFLKCCHMETFKYMLNLV